MRTAVFTLFCIVAFGNAMNAQRFSLLPQVGFENSKTNVSYNDLRSFAPEGVKFTPQASLRLNYSSKQGHGFFLGGATSRNIVLYSFADAGSGLSNFRSATSNMQVRLEGGYQFNSKRLALSSKQPAQKATTAKKNCDYTQKSSCGKSYTSRCQSKSNPASPAPAALARAKGTWMRIQPSAGLGFIPVPKTDVVSKTQGGQPTYEYRAGNWQTGVLAGTSFEFGSGNMPKLTVSVNYFKGLGNLNKQTITTSDGVKPVTTTLSSAVSGWNLRIGVPFGLSKNTSAKSKAKKATTERKTNCQYRVIRYRCGTNR